MPHYSFRESISVNRRDEREDRRKTRYFTCRRHRDQFVAITIMPIRKDTSAAERREQIKRRREVIASTSQKLPSITRQPARQAEGKILEIEYFRTINRLLASYFEDVRNRFIPKLSEIVEQAKRETRVDAEKFDQTHGQVLTRAVDDVRIGFAIQIPDVRIRGASDRQANLISNFDRKQFNRQIKTVLGVDPIIDEPYLQSQVDSFVERNVSLIKDIPEQSIQRIETKTRVAIERGDSLKSITDDVIKELGIAKNRSKLIARDQTNKFIGKLTELRQTSLGIEQYVWSTARDERVRSEHRARNGKVFSWDDPPSDGHPGEPIQCRCRAIPVLEDLKAGEGIKTKTSTGATLIGTTIAAEAIRAALREGEI